MSAPDRIALECVPLWAIVRGPGAPGLRYEVMDHGSCSSTVREVEDAPAQIEFMAAHGTERVSFTARHGRRPERWSGGTLVELVEAPPGLVTPLRELRSRVYEGHALQGHP